MAPPPLKPPTGSPPVPAPRPSTTGAARPKPPVGTGAVGAGALGPGALGPAPVGGRGDARPIPGPKPEAGPARTPISAPPAPPATTPTPWPAVSLPPAASLAASASDRRAHPRHDLLAQVQVSRASEVYILPTLNISRGGLFLQGDPSDTPELKVGLEVEVLIFSPDEAVDDVAARARVARIDDGRAAGHLAGFGLRFTHLEAESQHRLERLIGRP